MEAIAIACPNCGAGLGPLSDGVYVCSYCDHHSLPRVLAADPGQRAATLAAALAEFEARRARPAGRAEEIQRLKREALSRGRRTNGWLMLAIGGLFLLFALASVVLYVMQQAGVGVAAFGLFWLALGSLLVYIGRRYLDSDKRERRLREHGVPGRAVIVSYKDTRQVVDGSPRYHLVLRVEVPGRTPFDARQTDNVLKAGVLQAGADVPVFVSPEDPPEVFIDWFAA